MVVNTMGVFEVADLTASADGVVNAAIKATSRLMRSAAMEGLRVGDSGGNSARPNDADSVDALQSLTRLVCAMLHNETPLDRADHRMQRLELSCQYDQARTRINRQAFILLVRNDRQQLLEPPRVLALPQSRVRPNAPATH